MPVCLLSLCLWMMVTRLEVGDKVKQQLGLLVLALACPETRCLPMAVDKRVAVLDNGSKHKDQRMLRSVYPLSLCQEMTMERIPWFLKVGSLLHPALSKTK